MRHNGESRHTSLGLQQQFKFLVWMHELRDMGLAVEVVYKGTQRVLSRCDLREHQIGVEMRVHALPKQI